jgi:hypothetical protein
MERRVTGNGLGRRGRAGYQFPWGEVLFLNSTLESRYP